MDLFEHSGYFLSNSLARKRRANLFEAVILRSTVPFAQSLLATSSQATRPVFVCKLFDKLFRFMALS